MILFRIIKDRVSLRLNHIIKLLLVLFVRVVNKNIWQGVKRHLYSSASFSC